MKSITVQLQRKRVIIEHCAVSLDVPDDMSPYLAAVDLEQTISKQPPLVQQAFPATLNEIVQEHARRWPDEAIVSASDVEDEQDVEVGPWRPVMVWEG